jgi:hypothetical protein
MVRSVSTVDGGTALTTTSQVIGFIESSKWVGFTTRNFATGVVAKVAFSPYLFVLVTSDALAVAGNTTQYSSQAQDGDTATSVTLSSLDTAANSDFVYVGSHLRFRGVDVDVDAPNGTTSILTVNYWDGSAWSDTSDTDGTISGGATMAVDGQVTWAIPSDWVADSLVNIGDTTLTNIPHGSTQDIYWTRWQVSVALDSSVTLDHMIALPQSTAYAEFVNNQSFETAITMGPGGYAGLEALMNAGTGNLVVNVATRTISRDFV